MACLLLATIAHANTVPVNNTNDSGQGSLRQALLDVSVGGNIVFQISGPSRSIVLTSGALKIGTDVNILGPAGTNQTVEGAENPYLLHGDARYSQSLAGMS